LGRRKVITAKVMNRARLGSYYSINNCYETVVHLLKWHHITLISGCEQEDGQRIRVEDLILLLQGKYNVLHPPHQGLIRKAHSGII
jgi:hypothetical protein